MASIQNKGDGWYCQFLFHRQRHIFAVGKVDEAEAESIARSGGRAGSGRLRGLNGSAYPGHARGRTRSGGRSIGVSVLPEDRSAWGRSRTARLGLPDL